jgi:hypothetical protein
MPCCYFHTNLHHSAKPKGKFDDLSLKLPSLEDSCGIQIALAEVLNALASSRLDPRRAGLLLYGLQIATKLMARPRGPHYSPVRDICDERDGAFLGPEKAVCEPPDDCRNCSKSDTCEDYEECEEDEYEDPAYQPDGSGASGSEDDEDLDEDEEEDDEDNDEDNDEVEDQDQDVDDKPDSFGSLGVLLHELSGCEEDHGASHGSQNHSVQPQLAQARAPKDDAAQNPDVVRGRDQSAHPLKEQGHVLDQKNVAREKHRGQNGSHRQLECLGLRVCPRGDEKPECKHCKQEGKRHRKQQKHASVYRHQEDHAHHDQNGAQLAERQHAIGNHLSHHEPQRSHGRHGELLKRAMFALPNEAQRNQENSHDLKQDCNQSGDKEVCRARCGVLKH